jgi:hypothetical protein
LISPSFVLLVSSVYIRAPSYSLPSDTFPYLRKPLAIPFTFFFVSPFLFSSYFDYLFRFFFFSVTDSSPLLIRLLRRLPNIPPTPMHRHLIAQLANILHALGGTGAEGAHASTSAAAPASITHDLSPFSSHVRTSAHLGTDKECWLTPASDMGGKDRSMSADAAMGAGPARDRGA